VAGTRPASIEADAERRLPDARHIGSGERWTLSRAAATVAAVPGAVDFVEAAMSSARELVAAAARAELPQKLREVELVARIVRSDRVEGGVAFRLFTGASLSGGIARTADETNTVRLVFAAR